jgi:hypothetical protein
MIPKFPLREFWRDLGQGALYVAHLAFVLVLIWAAASLACAGIFYWIVWAGAAVSSSPTYWSDFPGFWGLCKFYSLVVPLVAAIIAANGNGGGAAKDKPPLLIDVTPEKLPVPVKRRLR